LADEFRHGFPDIGAGLEVRCPDDLVRQGTVKRDLGFLLD
jgi:hypothetical protein